jgi:polysaccharide transporter, PST family
MQFFKSSFWSGLSVGIKAVSSLIINKVIATYYDPSGIALLAHFQNFLGIFLAVPNDGLNMGVIKYLSNKDISLPDFRRILTAGLTLNIVYFLLAIVGVFIFRDYFISVFAGHLKPGAWIVLILISIFLQLMNMFFLAVILSAQNLKTYVALNIASSLSAAATVYFFAQEGDISLALLASAFGPAVFFFASIFFAIRNKDIKFAFSDIYEDLSGYKQLSNFVIMAASSMIFGKVVDFIVRQFVIDKYGLEQTGLWQSVVKLSDLYTAAFVSIIGMVYYPRISELINAHDQLKKYIRSVMRISIPVICAGLMFVYFFKEEFLVLLFEAKFKRASYLVDYQLAGDLFKLISFILSYLIFAQARTSFYIISQALSALVFIGLMYFCSSYYGLEGLPIAHAVRYMLYLLFVVLLYRKTLFA